MGFFTFHYPHQQIHIKPKPNFNNNKINKKIQSLNQFQQQKNKNSIFHLLRKI
jgi:hypothetical protein